MSCEHESFQGSIAVNRIAGDDGTVTNYVADISVRCATCGEPFHFVGFNVGMSFTKAMVGVGGTELRAPIAPGEAPLIGPIVFDVGSRERPS